MILRNMTPCKNRTPESSKPTKGLWLLIAALSVFSPQVLALASDKDQPIHISSDRAERDEKSGLTVYSGSVHMRQGTLKIDADRVIIYSEGNQVSKIIATGKPASYQQKPAEDKEIVVAKGETIEYLMDDEKLHLVKNASISQDNGNIMSGDLIRYDMKARVVKAEGNQNDRSERIHMVIQPKQDEQ